MAIIIFISAIVLGIVFRKSKICTAYILIVMYILAALKTSSADHELYRYNYNNLAGSLGNRYAGYTMFQKFFYDMRLTFEQYNLAFYLIVLSFLVIAIRILTKNINSVLSYYMIFSYAIDVVQMKSFIADTFSLIGIAIVIKMMSSKDRKTSMKTWAIAAICMIIAASMHFVNAFYLILIAIYLIMKNRKNIGKRMFALSVAAILMSYSSILTIILNYGSLIGIVSNIDYLSAYITRSGRFGFLLYAVWILIIIFSCRFNREHLLNNNEQSEISIFILTSLMIIPLLMLNSEFSRLLRIYMILLYIFYSKVERKRVIMIKNVLNYGAYAGAIAFPFFYIIGNLFEGTLESLLKYNMIFK